MTTILPWAARHRDGTPRCEAVEWHTDRDGFRYVRCHQTRGLRYLDDEYGQRHAYCPVHRRRVGIQAARGWVPA